MKNRFYILTLIMLAFLTDVSRAQDMMDTVIHIYEVRVFAHTSLDEKAIVSKEIDSIELSNNISENLSDLLGSNSHIYIRSYGHGGLATASFRGTAASHTRVYWNDVRIDDPAIGQTDFSLIPVSFIDDVKIYYGGSSLQKGSGAIGGSVHLNVKPVWGKDIQGKLYQKSGSFNTHYSYAGLSGGKENINFRMRAFRRISDNDFEYLNTSNGSWNREKLKYASSSKNGGQADLFYRINGKGILSLHGWYQEADRNFAPVMSYLGPSRKESQLDKTFRLAGKWKYYGDKVISKFNAGLSANELRYFLGMDETETTIFNTLANSLTFQTRYQAQMDISPSTRLKALGEFSYLKAHYQDLKTETGFEANRPEGGISVSMHHQFDIPLAIYTLLRKDIFGKEFSPLMPAAGIEYSPLRLPGLSFKTNLSRNFNYPDLNDLHWIPGGNPDLKPEEGYSSDFSVNYNAGINEHEINTTLTAHYSAIDNWILWKPGDYGFWKAENLAKVNTYGLEYQLDSDFNFSDYVIHLGGTYSFTRAINKGKSIKGDASIGKQLVYLPMHKTNFQLRVKKKFLRFNYDIYAAGKRFLTSDNDPLMTLEPYMLHDINISGVFSVGNFNFETGMEVKNLMNTDYQVIKSRPMPGRNYSIWLKLMF